MAYSFTSILYLHGKEMFILLHILPGKIKIISAYLVERTNWNSFLLFIVVVLFAHSHFCLFPLMHLKSGRNWIESLSVIMNRVNV